MKTIYKVAMLATPLTVAVGSVGIYLALSMKDNDIVVHKSYENNAFSVDNIYDHYKVFPELHQEDFYGSIRIKQGKAIIDDEMIAKIVNYIFDHMQKAQGDVGYSVKRIDDKNVIIYVKWESPSKTYSHGYNINLKKSTINSL